MRPQPKVKKSLAAMRMWFSRGTPLEEGRFKKIAGPFTNVMYGNYLRQAGPGDGIISPDGMWLVLALESAEGVLDSLDAPRLPFLPGTPDTLAILDLYLLNLETGALRQLTDDPARDFEARFVPDGSGVIWASQRSGQGDIYRMDLSSGEVEQLTEGPLPDRDPTIHGNTLVFMRGWAREGGEGGEEIVLLDLSTGEERRLTENDWDDAGAELSPDGSMICWTSKEHGHWESDILAMRLETGEVWNVSALPGREDYCEWHPTAPMVFFQGWGTEQQEIYRSGWGGRGEPMNLSRHVTSDHAMSLVVEGGVRWVRS